MIKQEYAKRLKLVEYELDGEPAIKLYGQLLDGTNIDIRRVKVSDLTEGDAAIYLSKVQQDMEIEFDQTTRDEFDEGTSYNDEFFSLSSEAMISWMDLRYSKDNDSITYPKIVSCMDGGYSIADVTECQTILDLIFGARDTILEGGRTLVDELYDTTTVNDAKAVTDTR